MSDINKPILIPEAVYKLIYDTTTYKFVSTKELNNYLMPIAVTTTTVTNKEVCVVYYTINLLRKWLNYIAAEYDLITRRYIDSTRIVNCIKVSQLYLLDPMKVRIVDILNKYFINPKSDNLKLNISSITSSSIEVGCLIPTVRNITDYKRLISIGYRVAHVDFSYQSQWSQYIVHEDRRLEYIHKTINLLDNLTPEFISTLPKYDQALVDESCLLDKFSDEYISNIIILNNLNKIHNKYLKDKPNPQYIEMIEMYKNITGYRLNYQSEVNNDTLESRLEDINYAVQIIETNPSTKFFHDLSSNQMIMSNDS